MFLPPTSNNRGAALLTALVLLTAIALIAISVLALTRIEARISATHIEGSYATMAETAAFEDAKNLLLQNTANDNYIVSSRTISKSGEMMRYTFISEPSEAGLNHIPLFSGGSVQELTMPKITESAATDLIFQATGLPEVLHEKSIVRKIETFGLSHLDSKNEVIPENRFPETGLIEPESLDQQFSGKRGQKRRIRYTYWIEDLEGLPNLDVVGGQWTDHYSNEGGTSVFASDFVRLGYGKYDSRTRLGNSMDQGARLKYGPNEELAFQFPKAFRDQPLIGQVAPGLSPREILLLPWETANKTLKKHPFYGLGIQSIARQRLAGARSHLSPPNLPSDSGEFENRFSVGLHPYRKQPLIPFGHGYPDEGKPRYNLNTLLKTADVNAISDPIRNNLPTFATRNDPSDAMGTSWNYLDTLSASIIDYADTDGEPTIDINYDAGENQPSNVDLRYRGIDSYPFMNEFFTKLVFEGWRDAGDNFEAYFTLQPWVELWNPSNQQTDHAMKLDFGFQEGFGFPEPATAGDSAAIVQMGKELLDDRKTIIRNEFRIDVPVTQAVPIQVQLEPNEYKVVAFPPVKWIAISPKNGTVALVIDQLVQGVKSSGFGGDGRCRVRLLIDDEIVEFHGHRYERLDTAQSNQEGVEYAKIDVIRGGREYSQSSPGRLSTDDFIYRATPFSQMVRSGTKYGTHFGDPRMNALTQGNAFDGNRRPQYVKTSSPGGRNYNHRDLPEVGAVTEEDGIFYQQQRIHEWSDGGYSTTPGSFPASVEEAPDLIPQAPLQSDLAPTRISNEGRYFSTTELGNIFDPVMFRHPTISRTSYVSKQKFYTSNEFPGELRNVQVDAVPDPLWGGGNSLRIGRKEHPKFDVAGQRASQLLDLFHVGINGTNLTLSDYKIFDPQDHQQPPTALTEADGEQQPWSTLFDPEENLTADSPLEQVYGHLNINSAPTRFEIETLLRGHFATSSVVVNPASFDAVKDQPGFSDGPSYFSLSNDSSQSDEAEFSARYQEMMAGFEERIPEMASQIIKARPFYSPSHFARVIGHVLSGEGGPEASDDQPPAILHYHNDAQQEELFARIYNTTSFSSRHFRIFTYSEVVNEDATIVFSKRKKVYEIFLRPIRGSDHKIKQIIPEVLSVRSL